MRAVAAASIDSGSASSCPAAAAAARSRRYCGFPPDRSVSVSSSDGPTGDACVAVSASSARVLGGQRSGRELVDRGELEPCQEPTPAVLPHHAAQPGPTVDLRADVVEEGARGLVHPVGVVEDQERGAVEHHLQEPGHDLEGLRAAVLGAQRQHLGRVREVDLERRGEQRDPRTQRRVALVDETADRCRDHVVGVVPADTDGVAQQLAPREVRGRRRVRLAAPPHDADVGGAGLELLEQPGLADAGLADDLDQRAAAIDGTAERGLEHRQLLGPTDEREARVAGGAAA